MRRSHVEEFPLITSAPESSDDEYAKRRRKYAIMMGIRTLCVLLAAICYQVSPWLSLGLLVGGIVLPWPAVLIANDRPPKKRVPPPGYRPDYNTERLLTSGRRPAAERTAGAQDRPGETGRAGHVVDG